MAKLKLTKNELKKQKDALKRYNQYLPTLLLKKQQLQGELQKIHQVEEEEKQKRAYLKAAVYKWADVFAEDVRLEDFIKLKEVVIGEGNIAGIDIPVFDKLLFEEPEYDYLKTPIWIEAGVAAIKEVMALNAKMEILKKQETLVREELRITTQRVNLFEKVKIPETQGNIRKIQISLGDMQTAQVVTGKIAKEKIQRKETASAGVREI